MNQVGSAGLDLLYERPGLPTLGLPTTLANRYGGDIGFSSGPTVVANFVATLDGVVALPELVQSNKMISTGSDGDRFVMALLRACADTVLIGSGTLRGSPKTSWTAEHAYPPSAEAFQALRRRLGLSPTPRLAIVTGSGSIDVLHPAVEAGATVLMTKRAAAQLAGRLPRAAEAVVLGDTGAVDPRAAVEALVEKGSRLILTEAGPHFFGSLITANVVDELFLTSSPLLAGHSGRRPALSLVEGAALLPDHRQGAELLSVRRQHDHLFLRYRLSAP